MCPRGTRPHVIPTGSRDLPRNQTQLSGQAEPLTLWEKFGLIVLRVFVFGGMFCEKAIELIRELQRMSDGQLPAFNVSPPR